MKALRRFLSLENEDTFCKEEHSEQLSPSNFEVVIISSSEANDPGAARLARLTQKQMENEDTLCAEFSDHLSSTESESEIASSSAAAPTSGSNLVNRIQSLLPDFIVRRVDQLVTPRCLIVSSAAFIFILAVALSAALENSASDSPSSPSLTENATGNVMAPTIAPTAKATPVIMIPDVTTTRPNHQHDAESSRPQSDPIQEPPSASPSSHVMSHISLDHFSIESEMPTFSPLELAKMPTSSPSESMIAMTSYEPSLRVVAKPTTNFPPGHPTVPLAYMSPTTAVPSVEASQNPTITLLFGTATFFEQPAVRPSRQAQPSSAPSSTPTRIPSTRKPTQAYQTPMPTRTPPSSEKPDKTPQPTRRSPEPNNAPTTTPTKTPARSPTFASSSNPSMSPAKTSITYVPGNLTHMEHGLLLSRGLRARIIAESGKPAHYRNGKNSSVPFHSRPDAGATFEDIRPFNRGGWVYVSNSEMRRKDAPGGKGNGGVGAITFDKKGGVLKYEIVLKNTTWNCGGGKTPWNTWVSCEEDSKGQLYQVSPFGFRAPEVLQLGIEGGRFESFAFDVRDRSNPRFFVTEDYKRGALQMWEPEVVDWSRPWEMLHGNGTTMYLQLVPNGKMTGGTFKWTSSRAKGRSNAKKYYPNTEGIDTRGSHLYFVSKVFRQLYDLNLDDFTYTNSTTRHGLFDGSPDQLQRIMEPKGWARSQDQAHDEIMYFTEEAGKDAGVHGRTEGGDFFTILESPVYHDEVTGLAFSPNGMHMYLAYQENGLVFDVFREDGLPFYAQTLDVKYHGRVPD